MHMLCTCVLFFSLLVVSLLVDASVSNSFKDCSHFFYMQTPPVGMRGTSLKRICQKYAEKLRYATLYDSSRRLPLYSAYIFQKSDGKRRMDTPWMYEPQLVSDDESGNMRALPLTDDTPPLIEDSQAVLEDYTDAVEYRRGPLNPDLHQSEPNDKSSTYTLTNVVPFIPDFLDYSWNPYLDIIRRRLNNFCHGKSFMVTGVTVSGATIQRDNRYRLAIPKHLWLAYCCPRFDRNSPYEVRFMFPSYGGYALNERTDNSVVEVPLKTLESFLKSQTDIDNDLTIFFKGCVSENTFKKKRDLTKGRVEKELSPECREFLHMGTPPTGLEHHSLQFICQRYNKKPRYVTLYNTVDHIPVYSAYTFKRSDGDQCVDVPWMYEPQLSTSSDTDEMQPFPRGYMHMNFEDAQAVLDDYTNAILYERGTLNPEEHQDEPDDKSATYTLTNVVPVVPDFNSRVWNKQEHVIRKRLNNYCRGTAYIVTGITTSGKMIRRQNINRVAVPTYLWSAYCCVDYDHNAPFHERYKFPSFAHYGLNDEKTNEVVEISVQKLKEFLRRTTFVEKNFQIFVDDCVPPASSAQAGVVGDFNHAERCKDSLYMGTPPRGYLSNSFKKICQRYEDKPRYVTLYDPHKHIPIYSAYMFKKSDGEKKVDFPWMFEPQLASEKSSSNMEPFPQSSSMHMNFEDTQAVLEDYADVVQYERGQLSPDEHQADPLDKASTYSLTNVVPQIREFNLGPWAEHQDLIRKRLNNYCRGKAFVVTGITTSGHTIRRNNLDRVAVPEYMWSAYCCTEFDQNAPYFVRYKFPVFGAYGLNDRVNNHMVEVPLKNLEKFLKGRMDVDKNFQIFYNDCVPDN
ncbi:hypothetical protein L3Q82_017013 [Scortum barcoo]|uniref:Uncharacterized protein n=1 Tax=Scortum barcoo TaxID=214431 RepID=A0ACB8X8Z6_9TELE|nr:hypothetical protein L3Q82_017013 [Scortum barcoo]